MALIFDIVTIAGFVILGAIAHEGAHYVFGWVFGARPYPSRFFLRVLPTQIDYKSPKAMGDWQTRITGGVVIVFVPFAVAGSYLHWWELLAFGIGGIGISWTDLLAGFHPEEWRKFTAGEEIKRDDFGWGSKRN